MSPAIKFVNRNSEIWAKLLIYIIYGTVKA